MQSHVKILAVLHIALGALGLIAGIGMALLFGGIAGIAGFAGDTPDSLVAVPVLGAIGGIIMVMSIVLALPALIAGVGLLSFRPWARILTIILSLLNLLNFPFGTALGAYGLWVLFSREGEMLFTGSRSAMQHYPR
jgi:hypothetical protein